VIGRVACLGVLLGLTMCVAACSDGGSTPATRAPLPQGSLAGEPALLKGRRIYLDRCAACHGQEGEGVVGPSFDDGKLLRDFDTVAAQIEFVRTGRGVMPQFGGVLDEDELRAVVRYEREVLSHGAAR